MDTELSLHERTKAVKPNQYTKPSTYWAAVLWFDREPAGPKREEDYLWIKCKGSISVQTIIEQYRAHTGETCTLRHNGKNPSPHLTMKELDAFGDHVIVFEATREERATINTNSTVSRSEFVTPALITKPATSTTATTASVKSEVPAAPVVTPTSAQNMKVPNSTRPPLQPNTDHIPQQKVIQPQEPPYRGYGSAGYSSPYERGDHWGPAVKQEPHRDLKAYPPMHDENHGVGLNRLTYPPPPQRQDEIHKSPAWQRTVPGFLNFFNAFVEVYHRSWKTQYGPIKQNEELQKEAWSQWLKFTTEERLRYINPPTQGMNETYLSRQLGSPNPISMNPSFGVPAFGKQMSSPDGISMNPVYGFPVFGKEMSSELERKDNSSTACDPSQPIQPVQELPPSQQQKRFQLQEFVEDASIEVLEACVEKGLEFLNDLKRPLQDKQVEGSDVTQWLQLIDNLQKQAVKTKTVIGVVGNTGAGKSSVINAMLDQERLVPTNTMRACTAVVTELSYNYENDKYRAEIEFIGEKDWEKELKVLFEDLLDASGQISKECTNEDSDAGIAYAKIKAVYPNKTKEDICNSSIQSMLQQKDVACVLGKTRKIENADNLMFYKQLQRYVDSKEKATGKKDKDRKKGEPKEMEFWPLIKVVRIYVKSPALSTGAIIVDLPGVHDANAARAAVAESYMKQCSGLWIVAPIIRAVDDKAAKNLLGESFKRQLKMDGGFSSVTFICSKTDDISLMEASDSLGLSEENSALWEEIDEHVKKQKDLTKELKSLGDTKAAYGEVMQDVDDQLEVWESLREKLEEGSTVFAPKADKKRKAKSSGNSKGPKNKRQKRSSDDEDDDFIDDGSEEAESSADDDASDDEEPDREPLTEEQISSKISELRSTKKEARKQRAGLDEQIKEVRSEIAEAKEAEAKLEGQISKVCIEGRNSYSKGAIQQDFAAGIKELDEELAMEENEDDFNPDDNTKDYEKVAKSLPVFCVSSRAYQQMKGRLKKDSPVAGFQTLEETEIPQLQEHCKALTVAGRTATCKQFMNKLSALLNSLAIWASNDGTGNSLSADQRAREDRFLKNSLEKLDRDIENTIVSVIKELNCELDDNIFDKFDKATANAIKEAVQTCAGWGAPYNRENRQAGGLHWATYKATCRRNGRFRDIDFNLALIEPVIKAIAGGWEKAFVRRIPHILDRVGKDAGKILRKFHAEVEARALKTGVVAPALHMVHSQLSAWERGFHDFATVTRDEMLNQQKDINREFEPVIEEAMTLGYEICVAERGTGSAARMKAAMARHVEEQRHTMFQDSVEKVQNSLQRMLKEAEEKLLNKADELFVQVSRDYRSIFGGGNSVDGEVMSRPQRTMRKSVKKMIDGAEKIFKKTAGLEVDDDVEEKADNEGDVDMKSEDGEDKSEKSEDGEDKSKKSEDGENKREKGDDAGHETLKTESQAFDEKIQGQLTDELKDETSKAETNPETSHISDVLAKHESQEEGRESRYATPMSGSYHSDLNDQTEITAPSLLGATASKPTPAAAHKIEEEDYYTSSSDGEAPARKRGRPITRNRSFVPPGGEESDSSGAFDEYCPGSDNDD